MHDCPNIQEKLFDLVMDEIEFSEQSQILAEVSACPLCQAELEALEKTLRLYDQTVVINEPTTAEWQVYERNLRSRFPAQSAFSKSFWRRLAATSIRIPAPVLAAVTLLICAATFLAFRAAKPDNSQNVSEITQTFGQTLAPNLLPTETPTPEKIIIREERVVTRNVYVTKRSNVAKQSSPSKTIRNSLEIEQSPLNLAEFKPVAPLTPNIVKGNKPK